MKLNELMTKSLTDALSELNVVSVKPVSDDSGNVIKIIVEYAPEQEPTKKMSSLERQRGGF